MPPFFFFAKEAEKKKKVPRIKAAPTSLCFTLTAHGGCAPVKRRNKYYCEIPGALLELSCDHLLWSGCMDRCSVRTYLLSSFPIMLLGQFRAHRGGKKFNRWPARHNSKFSFSPGYWRHAFQDYFCYIHEHSFPLCTFILLPPSRACLLPFSPEGISRDSGNAELLSFQKLHGESSDLGDGYVITVFYFFCGSSKTKKDIKLVRDWNDYLWILFLN